VINRKKQSDKKLVDLGERRKQARLEKISKLKKQTNTGQENYQQQFVDRE
jgi:hypothetical protein